jgi:hypothetical protein
MSGIEWRHITPEDMVREIEDSVQKYRENKYAYQTGLKDLDFDVDDERLKALGLAVPFTSISQAEAALQGKAITPTVFLEHDETEHQVLVFDHRPVGYSGFMDCVTHSLALTDLGLFEVGRYPAMDLSAAHRYWSWFLHRCLARPEEVTAWQERQNLTSEEFIENVYQALTSA